MKPLKRFRYPAKRLHPELLPEIYALLRKKFGHQQWWPGETALEIMVGAILTQNTAWSNVERAIHNLKVARMLSVRKLAAVSEKRLAELIRPAGYFNVKARRLKSFLRFLIEEYGGSITKMSREKGTVLRDKLLAVQGIGPETADSILLYALGKPFFVIDAYTKRIFGRHRLYSPAQPYESWRELFEKSLPRRVPLYNDFHAQLVHLGKHYCRAKPLCQRCPLEPYL